MKRLAIIAAALMLTLGLAQCKKKQPNAQIVEGETVHITVNVNNNGSRADVNTTNGKITFNDGDILYVGYNNAKVNGELTYSSSTNKFIGDLTIAKDGDDKPLHFYYLGGSLEPTINGTEYTVDISDQSSNYPVISYGTSTTPYTGATSYTTTLLNKCALVKFTLDSGTTDAVAVGGMMTKATIDFTDPGTVVTSAPGEITLHAVASNAEKWAILLSQDAVANAPVAIGTGSVGYSVDVPAIGFNDFAEISTINNSEPGNVVFLNRLTSDYTATNGQVLTGTLANNVKISIDHSASVTLSNATINGTDNIACSWAGLNCLGDATINLEGTNIVKGFSASYPGVFIPRNCTLTIDGTGFLDASSNGLGAGIGGYYYDFCGNITIKGGTITATGGTDAAGIGSATEGECGDILIQGGTVTATGARNAAGIGCGGGEDASCGNITIESTVTKVTALKGNGATYSIGEGKNGTCGTVTIGGNNYGTGVTPNQSDGVTFIYPVPAPTTPTGAINGLF